MRWDGAGNSADGAGGGEWRRVEARQFPPPRGLASVNLCVGSMDIEQLISEVSLTPAIWDPSHTKHNDRVYIANQWRRIGDKLGVSEEMAKKKFKNLRDQFRLELKKVPEGRTGDPTLPPEAYLSSWPWFGMMFFLRDKIHRRAMMAEGLSNGRVTLVDSLGNTAVGRVSMVESLTSGITIKRNHEDLESYPSDAFDEDTSAFQDSHEATQSERLSVQAREQSMRVNGMKRPHEAGLQEDFLAVERQRLELIQRQQEEASDSDRMFLLSLLSPMKALEPRRAQMFRLKVQQLLYEAQYSQQFGKQ